MYTELDIDPGGLTIDVLEEGFGHEQSESGVNEMVSKAFDRFADAGVTVEEVLVSMHLDGRVI